MKKIHLLLILSALLALTSCSDKPLSQANDKNANLKQGDEIPMNEEKKVEREKTLEKKYEATALSESLFLTDNQATGPLVRINYPEDNKVEIFSHIEYSYDGTITRSMPGQINAQEISVKSTRPKSIKINVKLASDIKSLLGQEAILLDVRTKEEYREGHLSNSINMDLQGLADNLDKLPNKDRLIVVYCRSGNRSNQAQMILEKNGYFVLDAGGVIGFENLLVKN